MTVLVAQLGGVDTPGVGWAMGQERIVMLLQKQNLELLKDRPQIYLVLVGEDVQIPGFKLAERLRDAWPDLAVQINLGRRKLQNAVQARGQERRGVRVGVGG